ncbi:MAG: hypothetical protein ACTHM6_08840 [Tepidisphaeraceae bacterium]
MESETPAVSSPPATPNPAPAPVPSPRDRLNALAATLVRHRDPRMLREYLLLRSCVR